MSRLSTNDIGYINETLSGATIQCFQKLLHSKFNIGDVLIKKNVSTHADEQRVPSTEIMLNSIIPQRYLVIHVDETTGISFLKAIQHNGKLSPNIDHSADFDTLLNWSRFAYYEVDPHFTDSVIFGEEFDVSSILKEEEERRNRIIKVNEASSIYIHTLRDAEKFILSLKHGDTFYFHEASKKGYSADDYGKFEFKKARKYTLTSRIDVNDWHLDRFSKGTLNSKNVYILRSIHNDLLRCASLIGMAVYKTKPLSLSNNETF